MPFAIGRRIFFESSQPFNTSKSCTRRNAPLQIRVLNKVVGTLTKQTLVNKDPGSDG